MSATSISGVSFLNVDMKHCQYYEGGSDSALYTYQVSVQLKQGECLKTMESKSHTPFMDWLIDLYIDWSIDLLMDWLIFPGVKPLFKSFGNIGTWFWLIDWLIGWLIVWLISAWSSLCSVCNWSLFETVESGIAWLLA